MKKIFFLVLVLGFNLETFASKGGVPKEALELGMRSDSEAIFGIFFMSFLLMIILGPILAYQISKIKNEKKVQF